MEISLKKGVLIISKSHLNEDDFHNNGKPYYKQTEVCKKTSMFKAK